MSDQTPYAIAFSQCLGIGPVSYKKLISYFKTPKVAFNASISELSNIISQHQSNIFDQFRRTFNPDSVVASLLKKDIQVLTLDHPFYPILLVQISDPPICLYVKGDLSIFKNFGDNFFAIVGTRNVTFYGMQVARQFAADLSSVGFAIVSGMALGVDAIAHQATMKAGGKTVAVLGCGVDIIAPPSNKKIYEDIISGGGAVISEFPPGQTVQKGFFVTRNRIVAGLSRGVLVVEGTEKSGTLITAGYAAQQGRDVFAPPSPITSPLSKAPNILIKNGAKMVTSANDIIEEYNVSSHKNLSKKPAGFENLTPTLRSIAEVIFIEPHSTDELKEKLALPVSQLLQSLSLLELQGVVAKNEENRYYVK